MTTYINADYKDRLETRYTLEYLDNLADLDYVNSGKINDGEPMDRYKKRSFHSLDDAMSNYVLCLVRENIYDCKLFEEVLLDGEVIRESYIEPVNNFAYNLKNAVNKMLREDAQRTYDKVDDLEKELYWYITWMEEFKPARKTFDKYREEKLRNNEHLTVYRYYSIMRPVSIGTYPEKEKAKNIVNFEQRTFIDDIGRYAWGYIEYETELTWEVANQYDLEWNRCTKMKIV